MSGRLFRSGIKRSLEGITIGGFTKLAVDKHDSEVRSELDAKIYAEESKATSHLNKTADPTELSNYIQNQARIRAWKDMKENPSLPFIERIKSNVGAKTRFETRYEYHSTSLSNELKLNQFTNEVMYTPIPDSVSAEIEKYY